MSTEIQTALIGADIPYTAPHRPRAARPATAPMQLALITDDSALSVKQLAGQTVLIDAAGQLATPGATLTTLTTLPPCPCILCGRVLTDPASIARRRGPVCESKARGVVAYQPSEQLFIDERAA